MQRIPFIAAISIGLPASETPAAAESVEQFDPGKTVTIHVGAGDDDPQATAGKEHRKWPDGPPHRSARMSNNPMRHCIADAGP